MSILSNVEKKIVVNAGHHNTDPGAVTLVERDEVEKIRDEVVPLLQSAGFEVVSITDDRTLPQSIADANKALPSLNSGLCIDIHLNFSSDKKASGVEAYYGESETSKAIAAKMSECVAKSLGLKDRGARPDTETHVGSLGWIRQTKAWATLIEVGFISNANDMKALRENGGYKKAAQGIVNAVIDLYGINIPPKPTKDDAIRMILEGVDILKNLDQ